MFKDSLSFVLKIIWQQHFHSLIGKESKKTSFFNQTRIQKGLKKIPSIIDSIK
jgi:hypothetical protein